MNGVIMYYLDNLREDILIDVANEDIVKFLITEENSLHLGVLMKIMELEEIEEKMMKILIS